MFLAIGLSCVVHINTRRTYSVRINLLLHSLYILISHSNCSLLHHRSCGLKELGRLIYQSTDTICQSLYLPVLEMSQLISYASISIFFELALATNCLQFSDFSSF